VDRSKLVPIFIEMLNDPDSGVRRSAADNLGFIGRQAISAIPNLEKLADDPVIKTRETAATAIKKISGTAVPVGP
jgi:HEAT repeat protein